MEHDPKVDHKLAEMIVPHAIERQETMRLLGAIVYLGLKDQPSIAADMTHEEQERIKHEIRSASTEVLQKRLEAISIQNPNLVARAMRKCGYKVTSRDGGMHIEAVDGPVEGQGLIGNFVDYDEWIKSIEEEEK
jgi:hypothetical protein